jgi:hypothetical protein
VHAPSCTDKLRGVCILAFLLGFVVGMFSKKSCCLINVIEEMVLSIYGKKGSFLRSFEEKSISLHVSEFVFVGIIIVITVTLIHRFRFDVYLPATKLHVS